MKTNVLLFSALILVSACAWVEKKDANASVSLASPGDSTARPPLSAEDLKYQAAIRTFIDSTFKNKSLNGSILVAKDGQVLYEQYAGYSYYRQKKDSITPVSSFHLASVSKTITAMGILKLAQAGKLKIEDPVSNYLPGFPLPEITVKLLLSHRSGLPNYVHYMERLGWDRNRRVTNQDVLDFIIAHYKEIDIARADKGFSYSNTNYALLALIIEKVSGLSYSAYLKQTFFDPLGMKNSYVFSLPDSTRSMPSYFHSGKQYAFDYLDLVYGDKNIFSTVQDLLKFDIALSSGTLLSPALTEVAYTPYSFEKPGTHNYGLGWRMLLLKNGKKIIYHNGWWHGNRTAFYRLPDEKVTIIALCNNDSKMIYSVKKLADLFGNYMQTGDKDDDVERSIAENHPYQKKHKKSASASHYSKRKYSRPLAVKK